MDKFAELFKSIENFGLLAQASVFTAQTLSEIIGPVTDSSYYEWLNKNPVMKPIRYRYWFADNKDLLANNETYLRTATPNNARVLSKSPIADDSYIKIFNLINLKEEKEIPSLYLYEVNFLQKTPFIDLPSDYYKYSFMIEGLKHKKFTELSEYSKLEFIEFVDRNKKKLDKIMNSFSKSPRALGSGEDGTAFDIGNYVLKIYFSSGTAQKNMEAMERLHKSPELAKTEAMIYDVGYLGKFEGEQVFYSILEKMVPVTSLENEVYFDIEFVKLQIMEVLKTKESIINKLRKNPDPNLIKRLAHYTYNMALTEFKEPVERITSALNLRPTWGLSFTEELIMKLITGRVDLHGGNLGVTNYGDLRFFDPAYG